MNLSIFIHLSIYPLVTHLIHKRFVMGAYGMNSIVLQILKGTKSHCTTLLPSDSGWPHDQ